eukprot:1323666-Amorphochlora_amoeboformis.AAC.2
MDREGSRAHIPGSIVDDRCNKQGKTKMLGKYPQIQRLPSPPNHTTPEFSAGRTPSCEDTAEWLEVPTESAEKIKFKIPKWRLDSPGRRLRPPSPPLPQSYNSV